MTLKEIKQAVDEGKVVHWSNDGYTVIKDKKGQYLIKFQDHYYGLTHHDNRTLNGREDQFYLDKNVSDKQNQ